MRLGHIENGIVLDHITEGNSMNIYNVLKLKDLDCAVALIQKVDSVKMGKKDIIKVDGQLDINIDAIGYVDPKATVNIIRNGELVEKRDIVLPEKLVNVIRCKNPRCISSTEQELDQVFELKDREKGIYRCLYCEAKAEG